MWIRMLLDIGWRDLLAGLAYCVMPGNRSRLLSQAKQSWNAREDVLITLSVRSAFDLALRTLQLPPGSEVLLSALTVPDMVRIVQLHGLVPVPVDTDFHGHICVQALRQAVSPRARMIVVAHLFGGDSNLDGVVEIAKQNNLILAEDCAQSFRSVGDSGHPDSDIVMFSFGPVKTATAMGGAVVRVNSVELRRRMSESLDCDPVQHNAIFARRLVRFMLLKWLCGKSMASAFLFCVECLGFDFDSLANSAARTFSASDLLRQLRTQPSTALLRLLRRRWQTYDASRIERRIRLGRQLDAQFGVQHDSRHSYWVYPLVINSPTTVRDRFCAAGFDATCQPRMIVVPEVDDQRVATTARHLWRHAVFLPWYPDLSDAAVHEMAVIGCRAISEFGLAQSPQERQGGRMEAGDDRM